MDSEWIGSDVIVGINATGKQIMGNPNEEGHTIIAEAIKEHIEKGKIELVG